MGRIQYAEETFRIKIPKGLNSNAILEMGRRKHNTKGVITSLEIVSSSMDGVDSAKNERYSAVLRARVKYRVKTKK